MKINFLTTLLLLFTIISHSQMAVSDPANTAVNKSNLVKNTAILAKAARTLDETKKSVKILKDAKNSIEKVSNVLRDINNLENIINIQSALLQKSSSTISALSSSNLFSTSELNKIANNFSRVILSADKSIQLAKKLLSDNLFKMNDAERLSFLLETEKELKSSYTDINLFSKKYSRIMNERIIIKMAQDN